MVAFDYAPIVAFANDIIGQFGREVTFTKLPVGTLDAADPLAGFTPPVDPETSPPFMAAFVEITSLTSLGFNQEAKAQFKNSTQVALIAPDGVTDMRSFDFMIDGDTTWKVDTVSTLKPGAVDVLYYVGVCKP